MTHLTFELWNFAFSHSINTYTTSRLPTHPASKVFSETCKWTKPTITAVTLPSYSEVNNERTYKTHFEISINVSISFNCPLLKVSKLQTNYFGPWKVFKLIILCPLSNAWLTLLPSTHIVHKDTYIHTTIHTCTCSTLLSEWYPIKWGVACIGTLLTGVYESYLKWLGSKEIRSSF